MAEYTFKRLSDVEALAEVPEGANAFIEIDGKIKKVPGEGLGGAGGIKTAIIKSSDYDNMLAGVQTMSSAAPAITCECINMTFEEAYQTMASGEPLNCTLMACFNPMPINVSGLCVFAGILFGQPIIMLSFSIIPDVDDIEVIKLYWTEDGLSTEMPSSGK
jgi:hypothetical protein